MCYANYRIMLTHLTIISNQDLVKNYHTLVFYILSFASWYFDFKRCLDKICNFPQMLFLQLLSF